MEANTMKVLVTGVKGQLGHDVVNELIRKNHTPIGVDIEEMDITDSASVSQVIKEAAPDAVIHCAAWTAVDAAEDEDKQAKVHLVNGTGTKNIAQVCKELDIKMMYISTDYVFDGQGTDPWKPDCKAYKPLNVYGQSKLEGELAVSEALSKYFIVRIAWVFGKNGNNFIKTMLKVGKNHDKLTVVNDQVGSPTSTKELAGAIAHLLFTENYGLFHATCEGSCSWADFTREIFRLTGKSTEVEGITTAEFGAKAPRPAYSILENYMLKLTTDYRFAEWHDAIEAYIREMG